MNTDSVQKNISDVHFNPTELWRIVALFGVFALVLGFVTFILYPQGITYGAYPLLYFPLFVFGMMLAYACAPGAVESVRISRSGMIVVIVLVLAGLVSVWQTGAFIERAIKLMEILFQDFVIAAALGVIGDRLAERKVRIGLSVAFAAMHLPLFVTASYTYAISVVIAALVVTYVATTWFVKTKRDIATVAMLHLAFYIIFGSVLSI